MGIKDTLINLLPDLIKQAPCMLILVYVAIQQQQQINQLIDILIGTVCK